MRILSVGNVVADLLVSLPQLPQPGDDVTAISSAVAAGGAFNVLAAARRQGVAAAYAGAHGTGPFGDTIRAALAAEQIEVVQPTVAGQDSGWDVAITDGTGERTFLTAVGAEAHLDATALRRITFGTGDVLHVSGYSFARSPSGPALAEWIPEVPDAVTVLVDPGPLGSAIPDAVRARADWWSAAAGEAAGAPRRGSIERRGADGCRLRIGSGEWEHIPGFVVEAVDTNGAGDAHVGAFAAALLLGHHPRTATIRANAAAALAVTRRGPATAPTVRELEQFLAAHPA